MDLEACTEWVNDVSVCLEARVHEILTVMLTFTAISKCQHPSPMCRSSKL